MGHKKKSSVEGAVSEEMESADRMKARKKMKSSSKKKVSQEKREKELVEEDAGTEKATELQAEAKILAPADAAVAAVAGVSGRREAKSTKDEIDDIFAQKRRKSVLHEDEMGQESGRGGSPPHSKKKGKKTTGPGRNGRRTVENGEALMSPAERKVPTTTPKRKTADGLVIYREDELKWNSKDAGGTPLCPFDCECCF